MFDRIFRAHPRSVGENYREHLASAGWFGLQMVVGGVACLVHAVVPALFKDTASGAVDRLHGQMVVNRARRRTE